MSRVEGFLAELLLKIENTDPDPDRDSLIWLALRTAFLCEYPHGVALDPEPADSRYPLVAYITLPTGQVSWHLPMFPDQYDGHSIVDRAARVLAFSDMIRSTGD